MKMGIKEVSMVTGLSEFTLRAWEKRYLVVEPDRYGRARQYTYEQVEKLKALKIIVEQGMAIRLASKLSDQELQEKVKRRAHETTDQQARILELIQNYKLAELSKLLTQLRFQKGVREFIISIVMPLLHEVGKLTMLGKLNVAQEHALSSIIREQIIRIRARKKNHRRPLLAFCTPEGDYHELGILVAFKLAENAGFPTAYFGPNLPAQSLIDVIRAVQPDVVIVSAAAIDNNFHQLSQYLKFISENKNSKSKIWLAGPLAEHHQNQFHPLRSMQDFIREIDKI